MDSRPQLERTLHRTLLGAIALICGCAVLGGALSGAAALHLTRPKG